MLLSLLLFLFISPIFIQGSCPCSGKKIGRRGLVGQVVGAKRGLVAPTVGAAAAVGTGVVGAKVGLVGKAVGVVGAVGAAGVGTAAAGTVGAGCPCSKKKTLPNDTPSCGCQKEISEPDQNTKENYNEYIRRVYTSKDEKTDDYYARIFKQCDKESDIEYVKRIDTIYTEFPQLACKDNTEYWKLIQKYYKLKYVKVVNENDDDYFTKILKRQPNENFKSYIKRMDCVYKAFPCLKIWRKIQFDSESPNSYVFRKGEYNSEIRPSSNIRKSIIQKYTRRDSEKDDDCTYFKRICKRDSGETDKQYVERITMIKEHFVDLPLWYNKEYFEIIKPYYSLVYARNKSEKEDDYYKRILTKPSSEGLQLYIKRVNIFQLLYGNLPIWNNVKYLPLTGLYYSNLYGIKPNEDKDKYLQRVTARPTSECVDLYAKRLDIIRWVNRGNDLFYNPKYLPLIKPYYVNFYKKGPESIKSWLKRIFKRNYDETDNQYVDRLKCALSVQEQLTGIDLTDKYLKFVSEFYTLLYKQRDNESKDDWLKRISLRDKSESDATYETRLKYLSGVYKGCSGLVGTILKPARGVVNTIIGSKQKDAPCEKKTTKQLKQKGCDAPKEIEVRAEVNKGSCKKTLNEEEIKQIYAKKQGEDEKCYFQRIVTKSSDSESPEEYCNKLSLIRKYYPNLSLWYSKKNINLINYYYSRLFARKPDEVDDAYYGRIVRREDYETEEQTANRVALLQYLLPTLTLWSEEKYFSKYLQNIYKFLYNKKSNECEKVYAKRVLEKIKDIDTCPEIWSNRIHLIQLATASSPIWCSNKYQNIKIFYKTYYKKRNGESSVAWLTKAITRLPGECVENSIKRVKLIKESTSGCGCWNEETFSQIQSSNCFSSDYLTQLRTEVFATTTSYEKTSSKSKSYEAKSSSSEVEKEVVKIQV